MILFNCDVLVLEIQVNYPLVKLAVTYAKIAEFPLSKFHGAKGKLHTLLHFINRNCKY